jgi:DNA-binding response OmpR family regulator
MSRILVVDDEIDTLDLFRAALEMAGHEVITVLNSTDALLMAELEKPQCVLLDIMMPFLDGFTLCKMMRLHPITSTLPIVFVTAYSAIDLEDRRREAGADMVVFKPISMDKLIRVVKEVLSAPPREANTGLHTSRKLNEDMASHVPAERLGDDGTKPRKSAIIAPPSMRQSGVLNGPTPQTKKLPPVPDTKGNETP